MRELMAYSRMCPVGRVEDGASGDGRLAALNSCVCHVLLMPLACFALKASFSGDPFTHNGCCYASVHILHIAFVCLFISLIPVLSAIGSISVVVSGLLCDIQVLWLTFKISLY